MNSDKARMHPFGGLTPVPGAARAASAMVRWLIDHRKDLPRPLATIRALLSPISVIDPDFAHVAPPTSDHFLDDLFAWREDACSAPENVTLFFFSGWGIGVRNDAALVLGDFGMPSRPFMSRTVSFDSIYLGMSPMFAGEAVAATQFYFVDAGREFVGESGADLSSVLHAFDLVPLGRRDIRIAPIFYSSVIGGVPLARREGSTFFGEALLESLNSDAAEPTDRYRDGRRLWRVSVGSLNAALERKFSSKRFERQGLTLGGKVVDTTICYVDAPKTKALVVDNRKTTRGPGMHVLIAGVSRYPHGIGGDAEPADIDLGIEQLSSAATSAYRLFRWLTEGRRFSVPLTTVRLLLSPSLGETQVDVGMLEAGGDRGTLQNFLAAAAEWRTDAAGHPDNVTIFYFAGHGVQRGNPDSVLLLEDFGSPGGGPLRNAVDVDNIFLGMAPSEQRSGIARTQLYFIDTCRLQPRDLDNYQHMSTTATFEIYKRGTDDRRAPIYHASSPGSAAYGVPGGQTVFNKVLLDALKGDAAKEEMVGGVIRKMLSVNGLDSALEAGMASWRAETGGAQDYALTGLAKDKNVLSWDAQND
ncbi:hypothetical protein ACVWZ6_001633 [Bradyrhizobium sp. GM6.1]